MNFRRVKSRQILSGDAIEKIAQEAQVGYDEFDMDSGLEVSKQAQSAGKSVEDVVASILYSSEYNMELQAAAKQLINEGGSEGVVAGALAAKMMEFLSRPALAEELAYRIMDEAVDVEAVAYDYLDRMGYGGDFFGDSEEDGGWGFDPSMVTNPDHPMYNASKQAQEGGYQGFSNYETWAVALWLDNDYGMYELIKDYVDEAEMNGEDVDAGSVGKYIEGMLDESKPELDGLWGDLLNGAIANVNWYEIGENALSYKE